MTSIQNTPQQERHAQLREWAEGRTTTVAGVELLIRGGWTAARLPWMNSGEGGPWVDFDAIPDRIGAYSSGEQAYLRAAASIGSSNVDVSMGEVAFRLDRAELQLVLAALAHAANSPQDSEISYNEEGEPIGFSQLPSVFPWPELT